MKKINGLLANLERLATQSPSEITNLSLSSTALIRGGNNVTNNEVCQDSNDSCY